jgi:hypothetical protein
MSRRASDNYICAVVYVLCSVRHIVTQKRLLLNMLISLLTQN